MRGMTLRPTTVGMVLPAGGSAGLETEVAIGLEPMTGMDIPISGFGDDSDGGEPSINTRTGFWVGLELLSSGVDVVAFQ